MSEFNLKQNCEVYSSKYSNTNNIFKENFKFDDMTSNCNTSKLGFFDFPQNKHFEPAMHHHHINTEFKKFQPKITRSANNQNNITIKAKRKSNVNSLINSGNQRSRNNDKDSIFIDLGRRWKNESKKEETRLDNFQTDKSINMGFSLDSNQHLHSLSNFNKEGNSIRIDLQNPASLNQDHFQLGLSSNTEQGMFCRNSLELNSNHNTQQNLSNLNETLANNSAFGFPSNILRSRFTQPIPNFLSSEPLQVASKQKNSWFFKHVIQKINSILIFRLI